MIRIALILPVIFGLIVGPNGCCCAGQRIGALFQSTAASGSEMDSCCESNRHDQPVSSCCSHCMDGSDTGASHAHHNASVAYQSCCKKTDSCLCVASIRPSIHRVQIETELSLLTDYTTTVVWRATELQIAIASGCFSHKAIACAPEQPGRACAIAYQRWNC